MPCILPSIIYIYTDAGAESDSLVWGSLRLAPISCACIPGADPRDPNHTCQTLLPFRFFLLFRRGARGRVWIRDYLILLVLLYFSWGAKKKKRLLNSRLQRITSPQSRKCNQEVLTLIISWLAACILFT